MRCCAPVGVPHACCAPLPPPLPAAEGPWGADDKPDIENMSIWAGVVPLAQQQPLAPEPSADLQPGVAVPDYVQGL